MRNHHVTDQDTRPDNGPNTIRILVATDNHVGYEERDPIRRDDSWKTFDEILTIAKEREVRSSGLGSLDSFLGNTFSNGLPRSTWFC